MDDKPTSRRPQFLILIAIFLGFTWAVVAWAQTANGDQSSGAAGSWLILQQDEPDLYVSKGASGEAIAGQEFEYFISYGNVGDGAASAVVVTDTLPSDTTYVSDTSGQTPTIVGNQVQWNLGAVAAGQSSGFTLRVRIAGSVPVGTDLANTVQIATPDFESNLANNSFTHVATTVAPKPDLSVMKGASGEAIAGQEFEYFLSYSNLGSGAASAVIVTDTLPSDVTYVSDDSGQTPTIVGNQVQWNLDAVAAGQSSGFTLRVRIADTVPVGTDLANTVQIVTPDFESNLGNNTFTHIATTVAPKPDLSVMKGASGEAIADQEFEYFLSYSNLGSGAASAVIVTDTLPSDVTYVSDDSGQTPTIVGNQVQWNLGTVAAGQSGGFSLRVRIAGSVPVGTDLANTVQIATPDSESNLANNSFTHVATTVAPKPDLSVMKGASGEAIAGQEFECFLSYSNLGSGAASAVIVTDTLPSDVTYISDDSGWTPTIVGNQVQWNVGTVVAGQSSGFTLQVRIGASVPGGTDLVNTVQIATSDSESNLINNAFVLHITSRTPGPLLAISQIGATTARLSWTSVLGAVQYKVYRDTTPYFVPADPAYYVTEELSFDDVGSLGVEGVNHFYLVAAVYAGGGQSNASNRVGGFTFDLQ
jgi:uncharacterized repeat protein (TIGR01451 family)